MKQLNITKTLRQPRRVRTKGKLDPYLPVPGDPTHKIDRENSQKVLTSKPRRIIIKEPKRKDDKTMANQKNKTIKQSIAVALLAIAAVPGVASLLGGSLRDVIFAAVTVFWLYAEAIGFDK